mmetsp:Transcript_58464/g.163022  ORF Transcript_58464/g.163022 Transcript_58464/m.163022 type:complete len:926 (+) Transcript_58464:47-2824(+)
MVRVSSHGEGVYAFDQRGRSISTTTLPAHNFARKIYNCRHFFVIAWPALALFLAPCALGLLLRASPALGKSAPPGTESAEAWEVFKHHFPALQDIKTEMVVFKCKTPCETVDNVLSRGYVQQVTDLVKRFDMEHPGTVHQIRSYYSLGDIANNPMMSHDRQSILLDWMWSVPPTLKSEASSFLAQMYAEIEDINAYQGTNGLDVKVTGILSLDAAMRKTIMQEVPVHEIETIWMPFAILGMALRSPRMLFLALLPMPIEMIVSFGMVYFFALHATVSVYAVLMMLMLCTSLTFDYALFTLTRYAEERAQGENVETSIITVISSSGRVVVVSGCVLVVAWSAMLGLPDPFKTFCVGASSMIIVCVGVQLTFVPSLLAVFPILGPPAAKPDGHEQTPFTHASIESDASPELMMSPGHVGCAGGPLDKAAPHMNGTWFWLGGRLTAFPFNIIMPLCVYAFMMPLTFRFFHSVDLWPLHLHMGHSFVMQVPRHSPEWATALRVQQDFPAVTGTLMPICIIATHKLPTSPDDGFDNVGPTTTTRHPLLSYHTRPQGDDGVLDVRAQKFFDANCRMVNEIIAATRGKEYALGADNFVSPTFNGRDEETGGVRCLTYWQLNMVRKSFLSNTFFFSSRSKLLDEMWQQFVSKENHAMLTFLFPTMDPFSPNAFALMRDLRLALSNCTSTRMGIPGLTFTSFSPGGVLMDLIDVASRRLPATFFGCVFVCFSLIAVWFGAAAIPLKLLLTVVVPITWTYGAAFYVYEDGKLAWTGVPGLMPIGDAGLDWSVPIFTLTFILGLALDYDVFLFERVREFREEGFGDREAIQLGLSATGPTISSAGLIMGLTFVSQMLGSMPMNNQLGFILVFSIIVDTFLVRTVLVPAMLSLRPAFNYWPTTMLEPRYEWLNTDGSPLSVQRDVFLRVCSGNESDE